VDVDQSNELDFEEFTVFLERLRVRPEIEEIFDSLPWTSKKGYFTPEEFIEFVEKYQKVIENLHLFCYNALACK
jgi:Ca2+-binding EF-hand superfamily protein